MKREPKPNKYGIEFQEDIELPLEMDEMISKMTLEAEADVEASRVSFRWDKQHVEIIKHAAKLLGVPYQTYMKVLLIRGAIQDIEHMQSLAGSRTQEALAVPIVGVKPANVFAEVITRMSLPGEP
jgi:predicted DNA binding CopG/RHH family protein